MRQRLARPLWVGVAVSVLLHAVLLGGVNWTLPQWQDVSDPPAIEARLVLLGPPQAPAAPPPRPKPPPPRPQPAPPPPEPEAVEAPPAVEPVVAEAVPVAAEPEPPAAEVVPEPEPEPAPPPLNPLPHRIDLEYRVILGPATGRQNVVWVNEGDRYTITSVTAATGFASLIYSGRFVQTSRGRIAPRGLVPEEFWDQRGDKHASARFDPDRGQLTLTPSKGAPRHFSYERDVQDALSLLFHLALTAPPDAGALAYKVFNGKKLRDYAYEVRGEETLETALGPLRTLHLARRTDSDGRFEVWLAVDRHYLPVRVLKVDDGVEGELAIASIAVSE